jgi:nicotinamide-nucleotide amidase
VNELAKSVGEALKARGLRLATAESCTGGWAAMALTAIPGSSDWFERGYVTYSNDAKREDLGVADATLRQHGAVSHVLGSCLAASPGIQR